MSTTSTLLNNVLSRSSVRIGPSLQIFASSIKQNNSIFIPKGFFGGKHIYSYKRKYFPIWNNGCVSDSSLSRDIQIDHIKTLGDENVAMFNGFAFYNNEFVFGAYNEYEWCKPLNAFIRNSIDVILVNREIFNAKVNIKLKNLVLKKIFPNFASMCYDLRIIKCLPDYFKMVSDANSKMTMESNIKNASLDVNNYDLNDLAFDYSEIKYLADEFCGVFDNGPIDDFMNSLCGVPLLDSDNQQ